MPNKFTELVADVTIAGKTRTKVIDFTVTNQNYLYMPKFTLVRRMPGPPPATGIAPPGMAMAAPVTFTVELTSPLNPAPFVVDEFSLAENDLRRAEGITLWGYQDRCAIYAYCQQTVHIQVLVSCLIDTLCSRE